MAFVIYNKKSTAIHKIVKHRPYKVTESFKTMAAAKAAITRLSNKYWKDSVVENNYSMDQDPQFTLGIAEDQYYVDNIEKQVTRTGVMPGTGKETTITMSVNDVGGVCDPFTERYWSM